MKRKITDKLISIKKENTGFRVILSGIKGTGKTYTALSFAKSSFAGYIYVDFERDMNIRSLISVTCREKLINHENDIYNVIREYYDISEEISSNVLFIYDEYTSLPEAVDFLSELQPKGNENILAISSFSGRTREIEDFIHLKLYPLDFDEFLEATGSQWYIDIIRAHQKNMRKIPDIVHTDVLAAFEDYLTVGGMPYAVNDYIANENTYNSLEVQKQIFQMLTCSLYEKLPEENRIRAKQIMDVLPRQLVKENKKFQFSLIRKGLTYSYLKTAMDEIIADGYAVLCEKASSSSDKEKSFKLYSPDVGLFNYSLSESSSGTDIPSRNLILENYIALTASANNKEIVFWESGNQAKLDLLIHEGNQYIPIEIKEDENKRSRSLSQYLSSNRCSKIYRFSDQNFSVSKNENGSIKIISVPYYAAHYCFLQ